MIKRLIAVVCLIAYYTIARHLPASDAVIIGPPCKWIRGILARRCLARAGASINIQKGAYFGRGDQIRVGNRSSIGINCDVHGAVIIGDNVMMGPEVIIHTRNHNSMDPAVPMIDQGYGAVAPVLIEDDVWIGARVIILPGVTIGKGSVVGAGAVVARSVPPGSVAAGNPCRVVRSRSA